MIHIFHKWTKWQLRRAVIGGLVYEQQYRRCIKCGYKEEIVVCPLKEDTV